MSNPLKVLSRVQAVENHDNGVYRVEFSVPLKCTRFRPGQFLHLTLDQFDPTEGYWPESRVFSIASEPTQDHLTIVYSVKGTYTKRMQSELAVGREVWLKLPYGDFVIHDDLLDEGPVVLVGGGTGVSPFRPFLMRLGDRPGTVHLFYGIRQPEHLLFHEDWQRLVLQPWFRLHLMIEDGAVPELSSRSGRLSIETIWNEVGPGRERGHYFLSGPPAMIRTFKEQLLDRQVPAAQIHIDEWE